PSRCSPMAARARTSTPCGPRPRAGCPRSTAPTGSSSGRGCGPCSPGTAAPRRRGPPTPARRVAGVDVLLRLVDEVSWQGRAVPGDRPGQLLRALVDAWPSAVPAGELVDAVWGAATPDHPAKALQVLVSRTRSATSPHIIERTATGYRLGLDPSEVDLLARERFVSTAES